MSTPVTTKHLDAWDSLYCRYAGQTYQQGCYVELDCAAGILSAGYNVERGNAVPRDVEHGHARRYPILCLTADAANELLDGLAPLAQRVIDGYESAWDGNKHVAVLSGDAQAAEQEIGAIVAGLSVGEYKSVSGLDASDWIVDCPEGLTALSSDEELQALAASLDDEAAAEHVILSGTLRRLEWLREELRAEMEMG